MSANGFLNATEVTTLRDIYGKDIVLFDEQGESTVHRIITEFTFESQTYTALQSEALRKEHEVALFKVIVKPGEEPELQTIEDDDEWETISELVDDRMYPSKE
ncbi:MAG: hypothetical protein K0R67_1772 [Paenibacillus sp.]|jgi:uncharacterized protein YrzB (UPF0473 family)|nr:hypothetical protein [Paenibacillus sp.]